MSEWISVDDRLPNSGKWYLCIYSFDLVGVMDIIFFDGINEHGIHWLKDGDFIERVTHWMPLPEPPEQN